MKKLFILFAVTLLLSCHHEAKNYNTILKEFNKNYTLSKKISKKDILFCWNVTEEKFKKDSLDYEKAHALFYKQNKDFLYYLLSFKDDTSHYNNWIDFKDPCSSKIDMASFINNSDGSLILIDNFLVGGKNQIKFERNSYLQKIKYDYVEELILSKDNLKDIRISYLKYIDSIR
jgi:hypothetical protein